jgi:hypothetical protein
MISLLTSILCVLRNILLAIAYAGVWVVQQVVSGIGYLAVTILGLLPEFPDPPALPEQVDTAAGWVAWFVPAAAIVGVFAAVLTGYLVFLGVRIALRWVKAL